MLITPHIFTQKKRNYEWLSIYLDVYCIRGIAQSLRPTRRCLGLVSACIHSQTVFKSTIFPKHFYNVFSGGNKIDCYFLRGNVILLSRNSQIYQLKIKLFLIESLVSFLISATKNCH